MSRSGTQRSGFFALAGLLLIAAAPAQTVAGKERGSAYSEAPRDRGAASPVELRVDATDAPRGWLRARIHIPAKPGPLTLHYPKWIPGEHGPTGPVQNLTGVTIAAGGRPIAWKRDPLEPYAFHCEVPPGAKSLDVSLQLILPSGTGVRASVSATSELFVLDWNQVVLYPATPSPESLLVHAALRTPRGWKHGTALDVERSSGSEVSFAPVSLSTLIDSPVLTGTHLRVIPLAPDITPRHELILAADEPEALQLSAETIASYDRLVREAASLFGAAHYRRYRFLVALSDRLTYAGLEHHESSDDRSALNTFTDPDIKVRAAGLLPHEIVHSWNGKHRRPAGMVAKNYVDPIETDLLWIYEGLTSYLEWVLSGRSGIVTRGQSLGDLAHTASVQNLESGRRWRPLRDVAVSTPLRGSGAREWGNSRRAFGDIYNDGTLIWLDADVLIRSKTGGTRSLDDFCKKFFGGEPSGPWVRPYQLADVIEALNEVVPNDWAAFFAERVDRPASGAPLGGIETGGYQLTYTDSMSPYLRSIEKARQWTYLTASLGLLLRTDGSVIDANPDLPGAAAGILPGMRLTAVNGKRYSPAAIREALTSAKRTGATIALQSEFGDDLETHRIEYRGGNRYAWIVRNPKGPDYLSDILAPRIRSTAAAPAHRRKRSRDQRRPKTRGRYAPAS